MRLTNLVAAAIAAMIALGAVAPAVAQETVLLTIDLQRARAETQVGEDIQRQVTELETQFRENLESSGQELQGEAEELQRQREEFIITDEVFQQRMAELQQQDQQLRQRFEITSQAMQFAQNRATEAFFQAIYPDIEAEMTERNGTALLDRRSMVASSEDIDITDDVIERVNGRITELEVQLLPQRQAEEEE